MTILFIILGLYIFTSLIYTIGHSKGHQLAYKEMFKKEPK